MKIFIDSSVMIAALLSEDGGSAKVLGICEGGLVEGSISRKVIEEFTAVNKRKFPELQVHFEKLVKIAKLKIVEKLDANLLKLADGWIADKNDVPILVAAKMAEVDVLLTLDIKHFIKDASVARKSKLKIMTPADFWKGFYSLHLH